MLANTFRMAAKKSYMIIITFKCVFNFDKMR